MKKENKIMKVYAATTQPGYKVVPQIRMQGEWLRELGFEVGNEIKIEYKSGTIEIRKICKVHKEHKEQ